MKLLIIGGSDAGISAALRAREIDRGAEITVLLADDFPNYSICGLPFFLSGQTPDWHILAHRTAFAGSLGTLVIKLFNLVIVRTGLRHDEAVLEGFSPFTTESMMNGHRAYYPGATPLCARITGDIDTRRLLGAQLMGTWGAEVSKRLDVFATALFHEMAIDRISDLDLSYTPPLSSPWDPVQTASLEWSANSNTFIKGSKDA